MSVHTKKAAPLGIWPAMAVTVAVALALAIIGLDPVMTDGVAPVERLSSRQAVDITPDATVLAMARGDHQMPRVFVPTLPRQLSSIRSTAARKQLFLAVLLPHILRANEQIAADRQRLMVLRDRLAGDGGLDAADRAWLDALAREYCLSRADIPALLQRVNIVPPSLALAQAALESGWGTSRVAQEGNALFGQWTDADAFGLVAQPGRSVDRQSGYRLKFFTYLSDAVYNYVRNLNTHPAYADFRTARARWAARNGKMSGAVLAGALHDYSERGQAYIQDVRGLISYNRLERLDQITLAPVGMVSVPAALAPDMARP